MSQDNRGKKKRGPVPDTLKIKGDWRDAVRKAIKKERPKESWPKRGEGSDTDTNKKEGEK